MTVANELLVVSELNERALSKSHADIASSEGIVIIVAIRCIERLPPAIAGYAASLWVGLVIEVSTLRHNAI